MRRDSPYNTLSQKHREASISVWCVHDRDIVEVSSDESEELDELEEDLKNLSYVIGTPTIRDSFSSDKVRVLVKDCSCYYQGSVLDRVGGNNLLSIPPVFHRDGWEYYRILGFNPRDVREFLRGLKKVCVYEILKRRNLRGQSLVNYSPLSVGSLVAPLTEKQTEAFLMALESGFYEMPKRATLEQIAQVNRVPRSTFQHHVRKAESKIVEAIGPYIQMWHRKS